MSDTDNDSTMSPAAFLLSLNQRLSGCYAHARYFQHVSPPTADTFKRAADAIMMAMDLVRQGRDEVRGRLSDKAWKQHRLIRPRVKNPETRPE